MNKVVFFALSLMSSMAFFCLSCSSEPELSRFERIAKAYCDCVAASDLQELNDKAIHESESMTEAQLIKLFEDLQKEDNLVRECVGTISSNLGKLKIAEVDSLAMVLPKSCPAMALDKQFLKEHLVE